MQPVERDPYEELASFPSPGAAPSALRAEVDILLLGLANRTLFPPEFPAAPTTPSVKQQPNPSPLSQLGKRVASSPSPFLCHAVQPVVTVGRVASRTTEIVVDGVRQACFKHPQLKGPCRAVAATAESALDTALELTPQGVQDFVARKGRAFEAHLKKSARYWEPCGMGRRDTEHLYEGVFSLFSVLSTWKPVRPVSPVLYSASYLKDAAKFAKFREVQGTLHRELVVVQYHSAVPVGKGRSWKWFTSVREANRNSTMEEIIERLALLPEWGERTHVTVAKIPAKEKVRFLCGPAGCQVDPKTKKRVGGGGMQIRFHTFNPSWIVETRKIQK